MSQRRWQLLVGLAAVLLCAGIAAAQSTFGSLEGTVIDQTGGLMPGVTVTVTNIDTNLTREVVSDERGFYRAANLPVGTYSVKAQIQGFATAIENRVQLQINQVGVVNFTLKPSAVEETVTVEAAAVQVNTVTAEVGHTVDNKRVVDLPLNGRSFDQLLSLVPGAVNSGFTGFAVNGARPGANNFLLNGTDSNNNYFPENVSGRSGVTFTSLGSSSVENIQEFRIVTNTYSAEYGRTAGAQINVVTKSGTNQIRGSAFEFFRHNNLQARNYFDDRTKPKPEFRRDQFGGSFGGPIRRDKTFFFVSYEGLRERLPQTLRGLVPNEAFRALAPAVFQPYLQYMGMPTEPLIRSDGSTDPYVGYLSVTKPQNTREDAVSGNILHQFSGSDTLMGHIQFDDGIFWRAGQLNQLTTSAQESRNIIGNATYSHIFSGSMMNEVRFGFNRGPRNFYYQPWNMEGYPDDLVTANITGVAGIGGSQGYSYYPTTSWQFIENLSMIMGPHRLKFGVDLRRVGETFNTGPTKTIAYTSVANFFNNVAETVTLREANPPKLYRIFNYHFYVQDDFQALKNLNLSLGLRYEYNTPCSEKDKQQSSYVAATKSLEVGEPLYSSDKNNFSPRVGFAWDVLGNGSTSVRGGWGLFYDSLNPTQFIFQAINPPFAKTVTIVRALNPELTWPLPGSYSASQLTSTVYGFDPNVVQPYIQQYNVNVQRQLDKNTMLELGYVGSRGTGLLRNRDINRVDPTVKSRPDPRYASIIIREGTARSEYNSFQVTVNRRFNAGLSYQVSYTLSRLRDDASSSYYNGQDMSNLGAEWAFSDFDRRHNLVLNFIADMPFGQGRRWGAQWGSFLNGVLGGWQLNGIFAFRTGTPFTVRPGTDRRGDGSASTQRVNLVAGQDVYPESKDISMYLNRAAFEPAPLGQYGNLGRNAIRGPNYRNLDLSVFKNFQLAWVGGRKSTLQLRAEVFNALNMPNFGTPTATLNSGTFGRILSTEGDMRQVQVAVKWLF